MHWLIVLCTGLVAACSHDTTSPWTPSEPPPPTHFAPAPRELLPPDAKPASRPATPDPRNYEPRVKSINPLPEPDRRDLERKRQNTNREIEQLNRRARFEGENLRADDRRRLRALEADRNRTLRQLRSGQSN